MNTAEKVVNYAILLDWSEVETAVLKY